MEGDALTHLDEAGHARMIDVSAKPATRRRALAEGRVKLAPETLRAIREGRVPKGDVAAVARIAGIQGAKRTADLLPLCHPLRLDAVVVDVDVSSDDHAIVRAETTAVDRTGVEMEALAAVAAATLAVYDMVKGLERGAEILSIRLLEKEGGRSGTWRRDADTGAGAEAGARA